MRLTRLRLRNYRVFEEAVDLEVPAGLVGIYGPNGAGKSYLVESVRWTLFGEARTSNDDVRTTGVGADCVTEVELEHEGHLYLVRRTLSGINSTHRAEARCDGRHVAEGVRDVGRYVQSVLGMDDGAFRASVFAEQKQLAAFSDHKPEERRKLVLRLLGITPLDRARDRARHDARAARADHERLRDVLPDLDALREAAAEAAASAGRAATRAEAAAATAAAARDSREAAEERFDRLDALRMTHDELMHAGRAARDEHDRAAREVSELDDELGRLTGDSSRLAELQPEAHGLERAEESLRSVRAVEAAQAKLDSLDVGPEPSIPDHGAAELARAAATAAGEALAAIAAEVGAATAARDRARSAQERSGLLSGEGACPMCGQALGTAFEQVQAHHRRELDDCTARLEDLTARRGAAEEAAASAKRRAEATTAAVEDANRAMATFQAATQRRAAAATDLDAALDALGRPLVEGEGERLATEVARRRAAATECARLGGVLERRPAAEAALRAARERAGDAAGRLETLREKRRSLGYRPEDLEEARTARGSARSGAEEATRVAEATRVEAARAESEAEAATRRVADGEGQHARIAELAEGARHLGRLSELLSAFRASVVAAIGPRLAAHAADLFAELTDHEYDRLEVDAETYDIQIRDAGCLHDMKRFSGSETDLANLALRVAISEHVSFQSGGSVGLLVLDEVFGPLDDDRRERMLLALERLRGRFRQVLVVTHASEVKEQLPSAIEVLKLPGRRASARVLAGA